MNISTSLSNYMSQYQKNSIKVDSTTTFDVTEPLQLNSYETSTDFIANCTEVGEIYAPEHSTVTLKYLGEHSEGGKVFEEGFNYVTPPLSERASLSDGTNSVNNLSPNTINLLSSYINQRNGGISFQNWADFVYELQENQVITSSERYYLLAGNVGASKLGGESAVTESKAVKELREYWGGDPLEWMKNLYNANKSEGNYSLSSAFTENSFLAQKQAFEKAFDIVENVLQLAGAYEMENLNTQWEEEQSMRELLSSVSTTNTVSRSALLNTQL